jgi:membrane-bound lytic murein transglycosylase D
MSQTDSVWIAYKTQFKSNLAQLNDLYCWSDPEFYQGKLMFTSNINFKTEFENQKPVLFPAITYKAEDFYQLLESLNASEKQNFIRYFSFHEMNFEALLKEMELPEELKYLAPTLSAMNQNYTSFDGKAGIWQLTHFQAVLNGLRVNQLVDERFNPWLSTPAFAAVMKQNMTVYKTPELAVLGYLCGNTKVKNAIAFAGENASLTQVLHYLPENINDFISAFQATSVFLRINRFKTSIDPLAKKVNPDTVHITKQVHFQQVSEVLGIPQKQLEFLNPQYPFLIVPVQEKYYDLVLPNGYRDDFVLLQDSVYNSLDSTLFNVTVQKIEYAPAPGRQYLGEPVKNLEIEGKTKIKYKLQTGDVLGIIAEKYDVEVEDLKYWNNISNERRIQAGKTLDIFVDNDKVDYYSGIQQQHKVKEAKPSAPEQFQQNTTLAVFQEINKGKRLEHTVKNGESPFTIAKKYEGVTPEDILMWNNISDARKIQIGQKLIVYQK